LQGTGIREAKEDNAVLAKKASEKQTTASQPLNSFPARFFALEKPGDKLAPDSRKISVQLGSTAGSSVELKESERYWRPADEEFFFFNIQRPPNAKKVLLSRRF